MASGYLTPVRRSSLSRSSGGPESVFGGGSLFDLHRQMNRLFDDLFDRDQGTRSGQALLTAPALEVHQTDDKIEITAELPGVRQEDIDLTVEDGVLTLRGEKRSTRTDEERGYSERRYGQFERSITLPSNVDEENCSADFKDGVLTITLPKTAERQRGRRIPLSGGGQQTQQLEAQNDQGSPPRQEAAEESARHSEPSEGQMG